MGLLHRRVVAGSGEAQTALEELAHQCVRAMSPSGEHILLHVPSGTYLRLDGSASIIVNLLSETRDPGETAARVAARFDIPIDRATADVGAVVMSLSTLRAARASQARRPTASGTLQVVRAWWRVPWPRRLAVLKVTGLVVLVEAGLRTTDVGRLASRLHVPLAAHSAVVQPGPAADGSQLSNQEALGLWATDWVLDRWLYDGTCLRQALVTGYLLRRHHPELHLGLIGEGPISHAWVEAEGMAFNTEPVTGRFTAFGATSHGSPPVPG
jgi:hypothetical protein